MAEYKMIATKSHRIPSGQGTRLVSPGDFYTVPNKKVADWHVKTKRGIYEKKGKK